MASSMLTGERRWSTARRGGLTVLGKIAVPKPVNLPSQRLENHGLDPNVEIVPKGTLSWGSRSSAPNAWGTSAISPPNTGESAGSPSRLNGRPSSSGSGTRPSTAGSDRSHEPLSNAWGPNSRPSSSSGILASNQLSVASTRPRSAEIRPGSSQLSRFAEPVADSSVAWGVSGTAEKLGMASSKIDSFSLSSGDFPTLGSEKDPEHVRKALMPGHSSHEHPASASSAGATQRERLETSPSEDEPIDASADKGNINSWKRDTSPYLGPGAPPSVEKWQRDPQQAQPYPNANIAPHQFDPWHGPPLRNPPPDGVWYRGGPPAGGPPFGPNGPPGGYPLEPFAYFHSQFPYRPISNAQVVPRPGAGPSGYHPKNGDSSRHQMPDSYIYPTHPMIPVRPGVYPGQVPYDGGYYGPPRMGFCNSNERDAPVIGVAAGPCVYNRYPNQNVRPDSGNFHARPTGHGPNPAMTKEQLEFDHSHDMHRGPYKVLMKQHDSWGENDTEAKREHSVMASVPHFEKEENDWEADCRKDGPMDNSKSSFGEGLSQAKNDQGGRSSVHGGGNLPVTMSKVKVVDESLMKKSESSTIPAETIPAETSQQFLATKKNATLLDKIEGLNTKARNSDGRFRVVNVKNEVSNTAVCTEKASSGGESAGSEVSRAVEPVASAVTPLGSSEVGEKAYSPIHKRVHAMQGTSDNRGKARFNVQEGEEWRKKSPGADSLDVKTCSDVHAQDYHASQEPPEKQELNLPSKEGGEPYVTSSSDSRDYKEQRAKMKEIANQRAKQIQKEEEERTREQKAKALAKLEELNRKSTLIESSPQKMDHAPLASNDLAQKLEESSASAAPKTEAIVFGEAPIFGSGWDSDVVAPQQDQVISHDSSVSSRKAINDMTVPRNTALPPHNIGVPKLQKHIGHKKRQNMSQEKNQSDKMTAIGGPKNHVNANASTDGSSLPNNSNIMDDPSLQHKKKNNRSSKNKHKLDDALCGTAVPSSVPREENLATASAEIGQLKSSESADSSVEKQFSREVVEGQDSPDVAASEEQGWSQPTEESHVRVNSHWKPQPSRRMSRNTQASRPTDKFHGSEAVVWAPVRQQSKNERVEDASYNTEGNNLSLGKNGHGMQNSLKSKRAEMERYVPKPIAKELSNQILSDEMTGKEVCGSQSTTKSSGPDSADVNEGYGAETKNGENKHNRHRKIQGSWQQRGSTESSSLGLQGPHQGFLPSFDPSKGIQKHDDSYSPKKAAKKPDNWDNDTPVSNEAVTEHVIVRDHEALGRGKRHPPKMHRSSGHTHAPGDDKDLHNEPNHKTNSQSFANKSSESEGRSISRTENHGVEGVSSHWQPKSQVYSTYNRQGGRGNGGQRVASQGGRAHEKEPPLQCTGPEALVQPHPHQLEGQKVNAAEITHPETKWERSDLDFAQEQTHFQNQGQPGSADHDENVSSGVRRFGQHHNSRYNRGQEAPYGGRGQGQDGNKQHWKHNANYEYHPVGSYNKPDDRRQHNSTMSEEPQDRSRVTGSRYKERGQNNPRRGGGNNSSGGNFYGRNGGAVARVPAAYADGE